MTPVQTEQQTAPAEMTPEADLLFREAADYLKPDDVSQLESAYQFSDSAHHGQFRLTGDPIISHPVAVTPIALQ